MHDWADILKQQSPSDGPPGLYLAVVGKPDLCRSLELAARTAWALKKSVDDSHSKSDDRAGLPVAIIGFGAVGHATAYFLEHCHGVRTVVFETSPNRMRNCTTSRYFHPNVYRWPFEGWDNTSSEYILGTKDPADEPWVSNLPDLSWTAGRYDDVMRHISDAISRNLPKKDVDSVENTNDIRKWWASNNEKYFAAVDCTSSRREDRVPCPHDESLATAKNLPAVMLHGYFSTTDPLNLVLAAKAREQLTLLHSTAAPAGVKGEWLWSGIKGSCPNVLLIGAGDQGLQDYVQYVLGMDLELIVAILSRNDEFRRLTDNVHKAFVAELPYASRRTGHPSESTEFRDVHGRTAAQLIDDKLEEQAGARLASLLRQMLPTGAQGTDDISAASVQLYNRGPATACGCFPLNYLLARAVSIACGRAWRDVVRFDWPVAHVEFNQGKSQYCVQHLQPPQDPAIEWFDDVRPRY